MNLCQKIFAGPEKYQKLYNQAVRDLGINSGRLKRSDNLKTIFKMTDILR